MAKCDYPATLTAAPSADRGPDQGELVAPLAEQVARLPTAPGVYIMRGHNGEVLYVGKARDLRSRLRTYFCGGDGRAQIPALMERVTAVDHIACESERQAILLERDLIAKFRPRYNIKLKDDKAYLSVRVDLNHEWPRIELVRRVTDDGARYYGPYSFGQELRQVLEVIKRVVPLRSCSDAVLYNRQRPCLEYQIKRCAAPCCLSVDRSEYRQWVAEAVDILEGKPRRTLASLLERMEAAAAQLRFEEAAALRDRAAILERFADGHRLVFHRGESHDAVGLHREGECAVVALVRVRGGRIADSRCFPIVDAIVNDDELLIAALEQVYQREGEVPAELLLPAPLVGQEMLAASLAEGAGEAPSLVIPQRGSKARLVRLAALNASNHFAAYFDAGARYRAVAERLAQLLALDSPCERVECVDVSQLQGNDVVGAVVVFVAGEPRRREYLRYRLSTTGANDDFASIYEVVLRRLRRGKERGELPDLLVVDGGRGQLKSACEARDDLGLDLPIIALAKMRTETAARRSDVRRSFERVYLPNKSMPVALSPNDAVTHFLQRLRDATHLEVVAYHRQTRRRRLTTSRLDEVPGIGPVRKRRLLREFGGLRGLAEASAAEIAARGGVPLALAQLVEQALRGDRPPKRDDLSE